MRLTERHELNHVEREEPERIHEATVWVRNGGAAHFVVLGVEHD